jgi:hypothetical protein
MYCPRCGAANNAEQRFCFNCGLRIDQVTVTTPAPSSAGDITQPMITVAPSRYAAPSAARVIPNSPLAIVSLVFGILAWIMVLPLIGALVAVVCGHLARNEVRRANGQVGGGDLALAGLILGYSQLVLAGFALCGVLGFIFLVV